jgi:ATP-dependent DNA helicase RecG
MRPEVLNPLFASVATLSGIGPRLAQIVGRLVGRTADDGSAAEARVVDLIWHFPYSIIDRRYRPTIAEAGEGTVATIEVTVGRHQPSPRHNRRAPYRVHCHDGTGELTLVFFHAHGDYLTKQLPEGETRFISGKVEVFAGQFQMTHPDYILAPEEIESFPAIEPVYAMTAGLAPKTLRKAVGAALDDVPAFTEWQNAAWLAKQGWHTFSDALRAVHAPGSLAEAQPDSTARSRLAYDELLANQLALAIMRAHHRKSAGRALRGDGNRRLAVLDALPYSLTVSQAGALDEILADMAASERMLRLLQGDVGSGKTIVALLAMIAAVEAGTQAALMAPTDILARQHHATIEPLCRRAGVGLALLTGRDKGKAREAVLAGLADGSIDILIGTHALFQRDVEFGDLAFVVIDEQHRFGVHQRLAMQAKGKAGVDMLVMTATPIPRTLSLTLYGDMESSKLTEKPPGRLPVDTRVLPMDRTEEIEARLTTALPQGARCYWVCPLVSESDVLDLSDVERRFARLEELFPGRVGLVHGQMKAAEKDACMARFQVGDIAILVATTVIEVGVDVPEASIMVVEHAERFGLAQLHQLRGRIGRGGTRSTCLLLYQRPLGDMARARLAIMRETEDGFRIAEEDLRLRGAGELLGTRQSGTPGFRVADLSCHGDLLAAARDDATLVMRDDPALSSPRGEALRVLLHLFERQAAVRLLAAG